jgi:hypothetical protein
MQTVIGNHHTSKDRFFFIILDNWFMVFNATFNNISVISWQLVLLVEEPGYPEKTTDLPQVTDKQEDNSYFSLHYCHNHTDEYLFPFTF